MITDDVKRKIALYLQDAVNEANVGIGGNSTSPAATDLDVPILTTKVSTTNSESNDTTIDFKAVFSGSQLQGNTLREFGLFGTFPDDDKTSIVGTAYSGSDVEEKMFARVNFDAIGPFAASDVIEFIFVMEVE
jgi:hypothetical protein